jgi:hypothetical protein
MSYDISDTFAEDDYGVIHPTYDSNWNTKGKSKGKGKGKGKTKTKRIQKDPDCMVIPPFGAAVVPNAIRMFSINSFTEAQNPYAVRRPTPMEPSMSPGHCVMLPDDTLVRPRLRPDQIFDANTQKVYHQALQAIYQMNGSHTNYYVQEQSQGLTYFVNLKGEKVGVYSHGNSKYYLPDDEQKASLVTFGKYLGYVLLQQESRSNGLRLNIFRIIHIRIIKSKRLYCKFLT